MFLKDTPVEIADMEGIMKNLPGQMKSLKEVRILLPGNLQKAPQGWTGSDGDYYFKKDDDDDTEDDVKLEELKEMEFANTFYPKDLKKASEFIRSQSPKKIFGIYFEFDDASIPQLQSLRKVLAELKTKTPAFVNLDFWGNKKITDDLMLQYLDELKKLTSL
jgi:hypothetical protein